jgi:hypothetical protein
MQAHPTAGLAAELLVGPQICSQAMNICMDMLVYCECFLPHPLPVSPKTPQAYSISSTLPFSTHLLTSPDKSSRLLFTSYPLPLSPTPLPHMPLQSDLAGDRHVRPTWSPWGAHRGRLAGLREGDEELLWRLCSFLPCLLHWFERVTPSRSLLCLLYGLPCHLPISSVPS